MLTSAHARSCARALAHTHVHIDACTCALARARVNALCFGRSGLQRKPTAESVGRKRALFRKPRRTVSHARARAHTQASDAELRNLFKLIDTDCNGVGAGQTRTPQFQERRTLISWIRALVSRHSAASTPSIVRTRSDVRLRAPTRVRAPYAAIPSHAPACRPPAQPRQTSADKSVIRPHMFARE